jgi:hypothetical protein
MDLRFLSSTSLSKSTDVCGRPPPPPGPHLQPLRLQHLIKRAVVVLLPEPQLAALLQLQLQLRARCRRLQLALEPAQLGALLSEVLDLRGGQADRQTGCFPRGALCMSPCSCRG